MAMEHDGGIGDEMEVYEDKGEQLRDARMTCGGIDELSDNALDAHRQVLEMAAAIEILTQDFESVQQELLDAHMKLREYSLREQQLQLGRLDAGRSASPSSPRSAGVGINGGIVPNAIAKLRTGNVGNCCSHEAQLEELKRLLEVKDIALTQALQERNSYKVLLENAEQAVMESGDSRTRGHAQILTVKSKSMNGINLRAVTTNALTSLPPPPPDALTTGSRDLPKRERFDQQSAYQPQEHDDLFWRKQYRDAVRMRKKPGSVSSAANTTTGPSLKIFSAPNGNRQRGIKDENVPFTRYIGISARQNAVIKEQHRMFS